MTLGDMRKRSKSILDYISRMQVELDERERRNEALERPKVDDAQDKKRKNEMKREMAAILDNVNAWQVKFFGQADQ